MIGKLELILSKWIGKWILFGPSDPLLFLILILILVFVSRMLVRALCPRCPVWAARGFALFSCVVLFSVSFVSTAECSPGNEPGEQAGASGSEAGAGAEALSKTHVETRIVEFLSLFGRRAPQQRIFDGLKAEIKLESATQADLEKLTSIMEQLQRDSQFSSPGEAASQLVIDYSNYYQTKYNKSLW
jgi:hypothetical protein